MAFRSCSPTPTATALSKYAYHASNSDDFDTTLFTETDAKLIPNIFAKMIAGTAGNMRKNACTTAIYKILSNKVVGERIATTRTIDKLQRTNRELISSNMQLNDKVANLEQQLAELMLANARRESEEPSPQESIASRVKRKRSSSRTARRA